MVQIQNFTPRVRKSRETLEPRPTSVGKEIPCRGGQPSMRDGGEFARETLFVGSEAAFALRKQFARAHAERSPARDCAANAQANAIVTQV